MAAPARIRELAERFADNLEAYKRGKYKETQFWREFIDPFFDDVQQILRRASNGGLTPQNTR